MSSSTPDSFDITQPPKVKGKKFSSKPQLKRQGSLSAFASKIKRNVTEGWDQNFQREDAWGRKILDSVHEKQKKGVEGDIPAPDGFANGVAFWKVGGLSAAFGVLFGFVAIIFLNCAEEFPKVWVHNSDFGSYDDVKFYAGRHYYIAISGCAGFVVGGLRYLLNYPETLDGLFKEIGHYRVEPSTAPATVVLSAISLGCGASLGPEQALGNIGGGLATYISEHYIDFPDKTDAQLLVLCGMCASFGALFPTPVLAVLLIYELGTPPKPFMETIVTLSLGALSSYCIYFQFAEDFFLSKLSSNGAVLALQWDYNLNDCLVAVGFGIVSGALCVTAVIMLGVFRQLFNRIRDRVNRNTKVPGVIVAAVIGGIIVGTVGWVLPLTIGDGNMACAAIIRLTNQQLQSDNGNPYSEDGHMTIHLLLSVLFMKLFCLGVSMNCGFVGGFVFPMITVGACAGSAAALYYPNQPIGLCVGCFLAAVPAGICPMPFTMLGIAVYSFYFGLYQTVPIYVAIITSYMVVCGSGLFRKLADRGDEAALLRKQELEEENDMRISNLNDTVDIKDNDAGYKPPKIPSTFDRNSFAFDKYGKKNAKGSNIKGESSSLTASLIDN